MEDIITDMHSIFIDLMRIQDFLSETFIGWYPLVFRLALASSAVIFGILILALCIWIAAHSKRGRVLAIFTGLLNLISCFTMPGYVIRNSLINADTIVIPPYLLEGLAEAESIGVIGDHIEEMLEFVIRQLVQTFVLNIPSMLFEGVALLVGFVTFLVTLIFFVRMLKLKPKALGVFAFLFFLARTVLFPVKPGVLSEIASGVFSAFSAFLPHAPLELFGLRFDVLWLWHDGVVASVDVFTANFSMTVLTVAFFLVAICALVTKVKQKKASKLASAVAIETEEAPAEEAPAEEAPAEEAPVEEAPIEEAPAEEVLAEEAPVLPEN